MIQHHGTIKKYTAALLDLFNDIEIQYQSSTGTTINKSVPIVYSSREKARVLEGKTAEQLAAGNYNVLPRANLSLSTMLKADARVKNKNLKINTVAGVDTFEYMYNSVPYEFTFELSVICRGMNEASMIIEQVAPKFNPTVNIDIWEASNLNEPTRVPVKLLDIGIENEEYESISSNLVTVSFGLSLQGNLYPPVKTIERIKDFRILINETDGDYYSTKTVMGWDVNSSGALVNPILSYVPVIVDIVANNLVIGQNLITVIYDYSTITSSGAGTTAQVDWSTLQDNVTLTGDLQTTLTAEQVLTTYLNDLTITWDILVGNATVSGDLNNAVLNVISAGTVELLLTITDKNGNTTSLIKTFTI